MLSGRFRLERLLGRGGMGEVWQGTDQRLRRRVAIKLLLGEDPSSGLLARFLREGEAAARLNHRNIATVHDVGEHRENRGDGVERIHPFLVLEYLEGLDLKTILSQAPASGLPIEQALEYGAQACDGLEAAHAKGIVHRDIKPANLMLLADGTIKICDFGIARLQDVTPGLTRDVQPGTPAYMSPEQLTDHEIDHRSDLYSLGATLYHLLTGQQVFTAPSLGALVNMQLNALPDPPSNRRPGLPADIDDLLLGLLAKLPDQRPATAARTAELLRAAAVQARLDHPATPDPQDPVEPQEADPYPGEVPTVVGAVPEPGLLTDTEPLARSVTETGDSSQVPEDTAAATGPALPTDAEGIARSIPDPMQRVSALGEVAVIMSGKDPDRARVLLHDAVHAAGTSGDAQLMAELAAVVAGMDPGWTRFLLAEAKRMDRRSPGFETLWRIAVGLAGHDPVQADRMVRSTMPPSQRPWGFLTRKGKPAIAHAEALRDVAVAMAEQDPERARALLVDAERAAHSVTTHSFLDSSHQARVLREVAAAMAVHDLADAERIARSLPHATDRLRALQEVAVAATLAAQDAGEAGRIIRSLFDAKDQPRTLRLVAKEVADQHPERARTLLVDAERIARSLPDPCHQSAGLQHVAEAVAGQDSERAQALLVEAERIARSIPDPADQKRSFALLAVAMAGQDPGRARALLAKAERIARSLPDLGGQEWILEIIALAMAGHDLAEVERIVCSIAESDRREWALRRIAVAVAAQDPAGAERIARIIPSADGQANALREVAEAITTRDPAEAERIARTLPGHSQGSVLRKVTEAVARQHPGEAERIARSIGNSYDQARALWKVAEAVARQDPSKATKIALSIPDHRDRSEALRQVAVTVAVQDPGHPRQAQPSAPGL
ncbi:hypothetical protein GCM10022221_22590 [Actinocorallia aurea]